MIIKQELRPCYIKGRKALFHKWSINYINHTSVEVGIIEYDNGVVTECYPHEIRFVDRKLNDFSFAFSFDEEIIRLQKLDADEELVRIQKLGAL